MNKHTKGQWHIDSGRHGIHIRSGKESDAIGGELVAVVFNAGDADLIAVGPELLCALQRLSDQCDRMRLPGQPKSDAEKNALEVIAKAAGGMRP